MLVQLGHGSVGACVCAEDVTWSAIVQSVRVPARHFSDSKYVTDRDPFSCVLYPFCLCSVFELLQDYSQHARPLGLAVHTSTADGRVSFNALHSNNVVIHVNTAGCINADEPGCRYGYKLIGTALVPSLVGDYFPNSQSQVPFSAANNDTLKLLHVSVKSDKSQERVFPHL